MLQLMFLRLKDSDAAPNTATSFGRASASVITACTCAMAAVVLRLGQVPGLRPVTPESGMFVLVDVGGTGLDGAAFAARLLDEQLVSVMPGASFGAVARNFIRLSLTVPDEVLAEACTRIATLARNLTHAEVLS